MRRNNKHRAGNRIRPLKIKISLKGEQGKKLRIVLYAIAAMFFLVLAANLFRPKVQLENTAEIIRIRDQGVLTVGVMDDMLGFSYNGEGLEIELARLFAEYLLPDTNRDAAVKFETVTDKTAVTMLSDGSVDVVLALMKKGGSSRFSYSYPYYSDDCMVALHKNSSEKPLNEMLIGYVQGSASETTLKKYISEHETKVEQSLIDKLLKREKELPDDAVTFETKAFASYPDMLLALENGRVEGAVLAGVYFNKYKDEYDLTMHSTVLGKIDYALACASDSPAIAQLADMFIYDLRESGELDALIKKYGIE